MRGVVAVRRSDGTRLRIEIVKPGRAAASWLSTASPPACPASPMSLQDLYAQGVDYARQTVPYVRSLPARFITGYWQNFDNPANELKLAAVPNTYDLIAVAFADATSTPGAVSFSIDPGLSASVGGYTNDQFKADLLSDLNQQVWPLFSEGRLSPQLARAYPMEEAQQAYAELASNQVSGKLVVVIDPSLI